MSGHLTGDIVSHPDAAPQRPSHLDAFCCSGTSPGTAPTLIVDDPGGFEVVGPPGDVPVVVLGGISADRHLVAHPYDPRPGWWPGVVDRGGALDPRLDRLIGVDYTAHSRTDGTPSTADQAERVVAVLDRLGVDRVDIVGASYGGMVALALAASHPQRVRRLVVLCAAHRPHPMATALRSIQRDVARLGAVGGKPEEGLALARALAMTTYRSADEFESRFHHRPDSVDGASGARFPVEAYLQARGRAFVRRFDATRFIRLSESIDLHDVDPERVVSPTTLISVEGDVVTPPWLVDELAWRAPGVVRHVRLASPFGHDAFLKEGELVGEAIGWALAPR